MQEEFKKQVLKELDKSIKQLEKLLAVEGSLTDIRALPSGFADQLKFLLDYFKECREDIDRGTRTVRPRVAYRRPGMIAED